MPVNPEFAGRVYPPSAPYGVSAAKIKEFAEAVGATDPVHTDRAAAQALGYRDVIAPPTFAVLVAQRAEMEFIFDPEAGVDFSRVVHGEETFIHHRPMTAGDEIVGILTVDSVKAAGGHTMIVTRTELSAGDGPVCTALSTIVVRGGE
jgi:acyl dehydratase